MATTASLHCRRGQTETVGSGNRGQPPISSGGNRGQPPISSRGEIGDSHLFRPLPALFCYINRLTRFSLLSPELLKIILDGKEPSGLSMVNLWI